MYNITAKRFLSTVLQRLLLSRQRLRLFEPEANITYKMSFEISYTHILDTHLSHKKHPSHTTHVLFTQISNLDTTPYRRR